MKLPRGSSLVLASHNKGKLREIAELLSPFGLNVKSAVHHFVCCSQRHFNLAGFRVDGKGLVLGERERSEHGGHGEKRYTLHCISLTVFSDEGPFSQARLQVTTAGIATAALWATRVSLAVTRITPGHSLRQNGNTARAKALFKPSAATSARRICASNAERSFG